MLLQLRSDRQNITRRKAVDVPVSSEPPFCSVSSVPCSLFVNFTPCSATEEKTYHLTLEVLMNIVEEIVRRCKKPSADNSEPAGPAVLLLGLEIK